MADAALPVLLFQLTLSWALISAMCTLYRVWWQAPCKHVQRLACVSAAAAPAVTCLVVVDVSAGACIGYI